MSFQISDLFGGAPTASSDQINPGQVYGSSSLPGAPSSSVSLNSGITFQQPTSGGSGFSSFDPNKLGAPADVQYPGTIPANPNTGGFLQQFMIPSAAPTPTGGGTTSTTSTTSTTKTSSATDDAINRLIDLAASQGQGGGGGGGIVALPTGIASGGAASSGGGLSLGAVAIIVGVIAIGAYMWHKHNKKKAGANA